MGKKIAVFGGESASLINFRGRLLVSLVKAGHDVLAVAPPSRPEIPERLAAIGVRFCSIDLNRAGLNPIRDVLSLFQLKAFFSRERPDLVLSYTIKPVIYGSLAARWAGISQVFALITGLGAAFYTPGIKGRVLRLLAGTLYRMAFARCTKVMLQNKDIADLFIREGIVSEGKVEIVPGSGVDTDYFTQKPMPEETLVFLLLARMLRDKGVEEYVAAARLVKKQLPQGRFLLVGDTDPNPAAISEAQLRQWNQEGVIEYRSAVSDVRPLLSECSVYVLPSYHEGMPRSVLEAMATGRPVITTDTIGCRETIINAGGTDQESLRTGENGILVPVRSIAPLVAAMLRLAKDFNSRKQMGQRGREIAEQQFDVRRVNEQMLRLMGLLPNSSGVLSNPAPHALSP